MSPTRAATSLLGPTLALALACLGAGCAASTERSAPLRSETPAAGASGPASAHPGPGQEPLDVVVHAMSKCPYAAEALASLVPAVRQLGPAVALRLEYVGREERGRLESMHGEAEVAGDMLQLCARRHWGYGPWLDFVECQVASWETVPEGWEGCAAGSQADAERVRLCADGEEGRRLLAASFRGSEAEGVRASPTIFIGGRRYEGARTETAFARALCARIGGVAPPCAALPPPPEVDVVVLADGRCREAGCDVLEAVRRAREAILGAKVTHVDYAQPEGRRLFDELGLKLLPVLLVGTAVERDESGYRFVRGFDVIGDFYATQLGRFDPVAGAWVARPAFAVEILEDARCRSRECEGLDRFAAFVERQAPGAEVSRVDYSTPEGRALWKVAVEGGAPRPGRGASSPLGLPLVFFGEGLAEEELYQRLESRLWKVGDRLLLQLGPWDPTAEICDNGADDDGDGRVDCRDPGCRDATPCRPEKARRLDLFAMSRCPYATRVLREMGQVLDALGRSGTEVDFRVQLIGTVGEDGSLASMHGPEEVEEDLRWVCVQHLYPRDHAFMEYVACRADDPESPDWEGCVPATMSVEAIGRCADAELGRRLLRESFEAAKALHFVASPTWLLNNRHEMEGRTAPAILAAFCERNPGPGCPAPGEAREEEASGACR